MNEKAAIITVGDEILIGQIQDTNSNWLSNQFSDMGIEVNHVISCKDQIDSIVSALEYSAHFANIIVLTGGLGPTNDDVTKKALTKFTQDVLEHSEKQWSHIKKFFESKGRKTTKLHELQALSPSRAGLLHNDSGTALGIAIKTKNLKILSVPGVPYEMKSIMRGEGFQWLGKTENHTILRHTLMTAETAETDIAGLLEKFEDKLPDEYSLSYLPSIGTVRVRLTKVTGNLRNEKKQFDNYVSDMKNILQDVMYGEQDITLEEKVGQILLSRSERMGTAESCTGGNIAHKLTTIPGSSNYFYGSVVAYDNSVKEKILGVSSDTLKKHGAVSEEVVKEMVKGCCKALDVDYAIATSGIAGPGGGTEEKPVGTIWVAVGNPDNTMTKCYHMSQDRLRNIQRTSIYALNMLRKFLLA